MSFSAKVSVGIVHGCIGDGDALVYLATTILECVGEEPVVCLFQIKATRKTTMVNAWHTAVDESRGVASLLDGRDDSIRAADRYCPVGSAVHDP